MYWNTSFRDGDLLDCPTTPEIVPSRLVDCRLYEKEAGSGYLNVSAKARNDAVMQKELIDVAHRLDVGRPIVLVSLRLSLYVQAMSVEQARGWATVAVRELFTDIGACL